MSKQGKSSFYQYSFIAFSRHKKWTGCFLYDCSMVAAFGSGAMFSLVSGLGSPTQPANIITSGVFFALVQGGIFKVIILLPFPIF